MRDCDRTAIAGLLDDDVAFHSPVADYRGRDEVVNLLGTIGGVIDSVGVRREVVQEPETVSFLDGEVGGRTLEGVLDEIRGEDGLIRELTLMLRPLDALLEAVKRMAAALADTP
jgi:hypothetical protein